MISAEERATFERDGVLALRGAADEVSVRELRAALQARLAESSVPLTPSRLSGIARAREFAATWGPRVVGAIDDLLGPSRWEVPKAGSQVLFANPPTPEARWDVPHSVWHLDYPAPGAARTLPGVQLFLCLDRVAPRGGGTVVITSLDVRRALRRELPWFRELGSVRPGEDRIARFMRAPSETDGESLAVVELTGEPGDVYLMHPWTLHAPAPSCSDRPRLVLTERIRAREG